MNPRLHQPRVPHLMLRCHARDGKSAYGFCGRPASVFRPSRGLAAAAYFCSEHAGATDAELPAEPSVRVVRLAISVQVAGVSPLHVAAQNEAVCLVEDALRALGCRVDVQRVTSETARVAPPACVDRPIASAGQG